VLLATSFRRLAELEFRAASFTCVLDSSSREFSWEFSWEYW